MSAGQDKPSRRWRLHPSLARLAFGATTQLDPDASTTPLRNALQSGFDDDSTPGLDLHDAAQRELGEYELIELIGRGGMGMVYRARQRGLEREVAVKLLSAGTWAPQELVEGLRREAQHAAQLQHPNIVTVHELGEYEGQLYYAMQLVRGYSLSQRLDADGPMPARDAARLLRTVAEAVDYAHRLGVLHLDLKPGNLLLDDTDHVLIADFGLARKLEQALDRGHVSGTPGYMAPEQTRADGVLTPATDVWALGAVLHETLTGHSAFEGPDAATLVDQLRRGELPPSTWLADIPGDLQAVVRKCLQVDPGQRYTSARALADDLGRYLEGRELQARPLGAWQRIWRWTRREPVIAAMSVLAVAALVAGVTTTSIQRQRAESSAAVANQQVWEGRRASARAMAGKGEGQAALNLLTLNIAEQERAGQNPGAEADRMRRGLLAGQGAVLIDSTVIADANPLAVAMSADGTRLAVACNDGSVRWYDAATLSERGRVSLSDRTSSSGDRRTVQWLRFADNDHIVASLEWVSIVASPANTNSWLIKLDSDRDQARVVDPPATFAEFADAIYSDDGRTALLRNRGGGVQLWRTQPWRPLSPLLAAIPGVGPSSESSGDPSDLPWLVDDEGRYALALGVASRDFELVRGGRDAGRSRIRFDETAGVSAWSRSHDGRTIALGGYEGRLYLFDPATHALRQLPLGPGREVRWISFSEDDAWLAVGRADGSAFVLDARNGESVVTGAFDHDFVIDRVAVDRGHRLFVVAGEGRHALWRLSEASSSQALPPIRIAVAPESHSLAGRFASAWSFSAGLMASAGVDGQLRLWRLPRSRLLDARAAPQIAERAVFDGRHVVDTQAEQVRVADTEKGTAGPWIGLPQSPGFAALTDDGRSLVLTTGAQLRVHDSVTVSPVFPVRPLPQSAQRMLLSPDTKTVLLGFPRATSSGLREILSTYSLDDGRELATIELPGPQQQIAWSQGGARLLAVGPADTETRLLDGHTLKSLATFPHDPFRPVVWADFAGADSAGGASSAWLVLRAEDERLGTDMLQRWHFARDHVEESHATGIARPIGVAATPLGAVVAGRQQDLRLAGGNLTTLARDAGQEATALLALSPDKRWLAHAFRHGIQLFDVRTGEWMVTLNTEGNALDRVVQVTFASDGRSLLARTLQGRYALWPTTPDVRPVSALERESSLLAVSSIHERPLTILSSAQRAQLRSRDPGPWRPAMVDTVASRWPPRRPGTPATSLDLTPAYNRGPEEARNAYYNIRQQLRPFPTGVVRVGGVDFDVRGMAQVGAPAAHDRNAPSMPCIAVPDLPVARVHLLLTAVQPTPIDTGVLRADVVLRYRDGGATRVPLRSGMELPGFAGDDATVPLALSSGLAGTSRGLTPETLVAPAISNPQPARRLACVAVQPVSSRSPLLVYAITVEPVVMSARVSR